MSATTRRKQMSAIPGSQASSSGGRGSEPGMDELRRLLSSAEQRLQASESHAAGLEQTLARQRRDERVLRDEIGSKDSQIRQLAARLRDSESSAAEQILDLQEQLGDAEKALEMSAGHLAEAYEKLHAAGISKRFEFDISHPAIDLLERLPQRFSFNDAHGQVATGGGDLDQSDVAKLLKELIDEGCVRQSGDHFEKTDHRPFF